MAGRSILGRGFVQFQFRQFLKVPSSEGYGMVNFISPYLNCLAPLLTPSQPLITFSIQICLDFRKNPYASQIWLKI